jgi:hypothetical protein
MDRNGSSAGHCAEANRWVKSGGAPTWPDTVGLTRLNSFLASSPAYGDSLLIGPGDAGDMTRRVYENSSTSLLVTDKFNNSELVPGTTICKSGVGGGVSCGVVHLGYPSTIQYEHPGAVGGRRQVRHLVVVRVSTGCYPGDSGGPAYKRIGGGDEARAAGNMAAILYSSFGTRTEYCAIDPVQNIGNNSDAAVWRN